MRIRIAALSLATALAVQVRPAAAEPERTRLAVLDLTASGVDQSLADNLTAVLVTELSKLRVIEVISRQDIRQMLTHEQDKIALGCDDASCLAEIGGALGAGLLASGTVGRIGRSYSLALQLIDIRNAKVVNRVQRTAEDEQALLSLTGAAARRLLAPVLGQRAGVLVLRISEEGADVSIDDSLRGTSPIAALELPAGPHLVRVNKKGFVGWARDIEIRPEQSETIEVTLLPSRAFVTDYEERNRGMRTWAWITTGAAAAFGATALGLFLYADQSYFPDQIAPSRRECLDLGDACPRDLRDRVTSRGKTYDKMLYAVYGLDAAAAVAASFALYFWIAGDDPDRYRALAGPGTQAAWTVTPVPNGASVSVSLSF